MPVAEDIQSLDMVGVIVGEQDRVDIREFFPESFTFNHNLRFQGTKFIIYK